MLWELALHHLCFYVQMECWRVLRGRGVVTLATLVNSPRIGGCVYYVTGRGNEFKCWRLGEMRTLEGGW